jgi:hypothetical protein
MFIKTFTDPQGVSHINAIFEVSMSKINSNSYNNYDFKISQGDDEVNKIITNYNNRTVRYQIYYWTNQEARDAGNLPYLLANTSPISDEFFVSSEFLDNNPEYDGLDAFSIAEKHCQEVILV